MKARIKGESEWKDYKMVFGSDGTFLGLETAGYYCKSEPKQDVSILPLEESEPRQYVSEILPLECFDLWSEPDWDAYRREAAKDIVCAVLSAGMEQTDDEDKHFHSFEELAKASVKWADELIRLLKEEE